MQSVDDMTGITLQTIIDNSILNGFADGVSQKFVFLFLHFPFSWGFLTPQHFANWICLYVKVKKCGKDPGLVGLISVTEHATQTELIIKLSVCRRTYVTDLRFAWHYIQH
jgi:hypothetical protein